MHAVSTHLTSAMSAEEDHVLQTIHANRAARLQHTELTITHNTFQQNWLPASKLTVGNSDTTSDSAYTDYYWEQLVHKNQQKKIQKHKYINTLLLANADLNKAFTSTYSLTLRH